MNNYNIRNRFPWPYQRAASQSKGLRFFKYVPWRALSLSPMIDGDNVIMFLAIVIDLILNIWKWVRKGWPTRGGVSQQFEGYCRLHGAERSGRWVKRRKQTTIAYWRLYHYWLSALIKRWRSDPVPVLTATTADRFYCYRTNNV